LVLLFAALVLGLCVGRWPQFPQQLHAWAGRAASAALLLMLFAMGVRIGADPVTMANIPDLGSKALLLALGAVAGSVLAVDAGVMLFRKLRREGGRS
jgi:hypothetical protein